MLLAYHGVCDVKDAHLTRKRGAIAAPHGLRAQFQQSIAPANQRIGHPPHTLVLSRYSLQRQALKLMSPSDRRWGRNGPRRRWTAVSWLRRTRRWRGSPCASRRTSSRSRSWRKTGSPSTTSGWSWRSASPRWSIWWLSSAGASPGSKSGHPGDSNGSVLWGSGHKY